MPFFLPSSRKKHYRNAAVREQRERGRGAEKAFKTMISPHTKKIKNIFFFQKSKIYYGKSLLLSSKIKQTKTKTCKYILLEPFFTLYFKKNIRRKSYILRWNVYVPTESQIIYTCYKYTWYYICVFVYTLYIYMYT